MLGISALHCNSLIHEVLGFLDLLAYIWMMQSWGHHLLSLGMSSLWEVGLTLQDQQGSGRRSIRNHQLVQTERERERLALEGGPQREYLGHSKEKPLCFDWFGSVRVFEGAD